MRRAIRFCATVLFFSGIAWFASQAPAQAYDLRIATRDGARNVTVLPARRGPAPTVIVLHGIAISASWTSRFPDSRKRLAIEASRPSTRRA